MSYLKKSDFLFYFQEVPPVDNAVSMRAKYIIEESVRSLGNEGSVLVRTATANPSSVKGAVFRSFPIGRTDGKGFFKRTFSEVLMGIRLMLDILSNRGRKVIFISSPSYFVMLLAGTFARVLKRKLILDVRDIYPQAFEAIGLLRSDSVFFRALSKWTNWLYESSTLISVSTDDLNNNISSVPSISNKVITIFNGYPKAIHDINQKKNERFTVCCHGLFGRFQDVDGLLLVASKLASENIDFIFIGYGPKSNLLVDSLPSNSRFLGKLPNEETLKIVASCHLGLSLRTNDPISQGSFPVKIWEYVGLGLDVISAPFSEAGGFLERNNLGYQFSYGDYEGVISKIKEIKEWGSLFSDVNCSFDFTRENQSKKLINEMKSRL